MKYFLRWTSLWLLLFCVLVLTSSCSTSNKAESTAPVVLKKPVKTKLNDKSLVETLETLLRDSRATIEQKHSYISIGMSSYYIFDAGNHIRPYFKQTFSSLAKTLQQYHYQKILVLAYTDSKADLLTNKRLSTTWANTVANYLKQAGIRSDSITAQGNGEYNPIATNFTFAGRLLNRRVEIHVYLYPPETKMGI